MNRPSVWLLRRALVTAVAIALLGSFAVAVAPFAGVTPAASAAGSGFAGVAPARLWDTRAEFTTVDGASQGTGRLGPDSVYALQVTGRGGVPANGVAAVAVNVTAINPDAPSFLTVFPDGTARPEASNVNMAPGRSLPNMAIVPVSASGRIAVYNLAGTTDVAIDVLGWFPTGSSFSGLTPVRLWDTRSAPGTGTVDGTSLGTGRLGAEGVYRLRVAGRAGVPSTGVGAVAINITAIDPDAPSFLTVYPAGRPRPVASNLNTAPGRTLPNMAIVPVPASGEIDIYNLAGATDVAVDLLGWFASGADALQPLTPARLWETRTGTGLTTVDGQQQGTGALGPEGVGTVQVTGRAGIPSSGVNAVALNVTAIDPDAPSFLTVYPHGRARPIASNLNTAPGRTLPNSVIVPVSADGKIDVYNLAGITHVAVDVLGWFPSGGSGVSTSGRLWHNSVAVEADFGSMISDFVGTPTIEIDPNDTAVPAPDGSSYVVYDYDFFDDLTTVTMKDTATGAARYVSEWGGYVSDVQVSPNSETQAMLTFATTAASGDDDKFLYDFATDQLGEQIGGPTDVTGWLPDGRYIVATEDGAITIGTPGGPRTHFGTIGPFDGRTLLDIVVSHDGTRMLTRWERVVDIPNSQLDPKLSDLWMSDVDGSNPYRFTAGDDAVEAIWAPDDSAVILTQIIGRTVCTGQSCGTAGCDIHLVASTALDFRPVYGAGNVVVADADGDPNYVGCDVTGWTS